MNSMLLNAGIRQKIRVLNPTSFSSLISMLFLAMLFTLLLALDNTIFSSVLVLGFGGYGLYSLSRHDYAGWFSAVCFFCGAESILRNGLPAAYMFFFYYLIGSGVLFLFTHSAVQRFRLASATGLIFLLALLHFLHVDLQELRFGIGKWGLIWTALFFRMWIAQSLKLNVDFHISIWFYMLGSVTVLFSFLLAPQYFDGRYWPTFDGTGPVAASIGLLVLTLIQQLNPRLWLSGNNLLVGGLLVVSIIALVMLGSRGTFFGLAVATIFFLFTRPGLWNKILIVLFIFMLVGLIYYVDQSAIGNKVLSTRVEEATEENTREGRMFINSAVFLSFPENPVLGKGTGSWRHYNNQYIAAVFDRRYPKGLIMTDAHNTPLHLLFEHGIVGVSFFIGALIILLKRGYFLSKYTGIFVFPMILFSFSLGLSTMHKQASMFLPFLIGMAYLVPINQRKS